MNLFRRCAPLWLLLAASHPALAGPRIAVLLKGKSDFWNAVGKGATDAAVKAGAEVIIKAPPAETDVAIQIALLHSLGALGIQALVIAPTNKDSLAGPVAALASTGVKIIVIDSALSGNASSAFVGTDQHAAGAAGGALLATLIGENDEVAFLRHSQLGGATALREAGAMEKLQASHPQIVIHGDIYASTEEGVETERSQLLLSKYPGAKAVFASGTPGTMAMLHVLTQRKNGGSIKFIGCGFNLNADVVAAIKSGVMAGWVAQLPRDIGTKSIETALSVLGGQTVAAVIPTEFLVVTKSNLDDPKVQALLSL